MKYLLVTAFVLAVFWLWRHNRVADKKTNARPAAKRLSPVEMVACAACGVHLPAVDALPGRQGHYCCEAHRGQAER